MLARFAGLCLPHEKGGLDSFAGGIAVVLLGILAVALLAAGCAFGLTAQGSAIGRTVLFILSIIVISGLIEMTKTSFYLLGFFGIPGLTLAFLVVADRRVKDLTRLLVSAAPESPADSLGPTRRTGWMTVLQIMGVGVGLAMALALCRANLDIESIEEIIVWMLRIGVAVAALVLSIRTACELGRARRLDGEIRTEPEPRRLRRAGWKAVTVRQRGRTEVPRKLPFVAGQQRSPRVVSRW